MGFDENDEIQPYTEKVWFKNDGSNSIITGYTLRGRQKLKSSVEGFKETLKKGFSSSIDGIDYRILDTRKCGVAYEIEVQMKDKNEKGIAMVKLYGPYDQKDKKDNVVMVQKRKQNDEKFVTMLAEKIVKPLIYGFAKSKEIEAEPEEEDELDISNKNPKEEKTSEMFKCPQCEKTSTSSAGIKVHITRKHKANSNDDELFKEANKVVDLLNEVVVIREDEESIEDVTIEENCETEACGLVKNYVSKCDLCGFDVTTIKKYLGIQKIAKHKEACSMRKCDECDYFAKDKSNMKRHMRDTHEISSISTSPPTKRKRRIEVGNNESELMEVEEDEHYVEELSLSMEEMEIDQEEKILEERREYQDYKTKNKQLKQEKEELELRKKKLDVLEHQKSEEKKKAACDKNQKRKKKQKEKDMKKKLRKKSKNNANKVVNLKDIPENVKHLVGPDDVVYEVPGDGACGPNSVAAHIFEDENEGPKLRLLLNKFMAEHWDKQYKYLTQCSPETPFIRKCKGRQIKFTDPTELTKFLKDSHDAAFMWTDSEDLKVLADMYQVRIKVITTKGLDDKSVTVNWIYPDESMKEFSELKNVELKDITLLHQNDGHFNLIVNKHSNIAVDGSVTQRLLSGLELEMEESEQEVEVKTKAGDDSKIIENQYISEMEEKLQKYKKSLELVEEEYKKCERELRFKTEEAEKYKIEIKDLRKIIELGKEFENDSETKTVQKRKRKFVNDVQVKLDSVSKSATKVFDCKICPFSAAKLDVLNKHIESHRQSRKEYNCMGCDFQGTTEMQLQKHTNLKHTMKGITTYGTIKCRICSEEFSEKWNLMMHRKTVHPNTVAFCKKFEKGECTYKTESCWWNHEKKDHEDGFNCFFCGKVFGKKSEMMIHKKKEHTSLIKSCKDFLKGCCRFQETFCWFVHPNEKENNKSSKNEELNPTHTSVFQKEKTNLKPPLKGEMKSYAEVVSN